MFGNAGKRLDKKTRKGKFQNWIKFGNSWFIFINRFTRTINTQFVTISYTIGRWGDIMKSNKTGRNIIVIRIIIRID